MKKMYVFFIMLTLFSPILGKTAEKQLSHKEIKEKLDAMQKKYGTSKITETTKEPEKYKSRKKVAPVYKYHINVILELDNDLVPERKVGRFYMEPLLTFSLLDANGNLASPRFGKFFYISPGDVGLRIDLPTRGPFFINYTDFNLQHDGIPSKKKLFPINIEKILKEDIKLKKVMDLKGFGPFEIDKDDYEATFIIRISKNPRHNFKGPVGKYHFHQLDFLKKKTESLFG